MDMMDPSITNHSVDSTLSASRHKRSQYSPMQKKLKTTQNNCNNHSANSDHHGSQLLQISTHQHPLTNQEANQVQAHAAPDEKFSYKEMFGPNNQKLELLDTEQKKKLAEHILHIHQLEKQLDQSRRNIQRIVDNERKLKRLYTLTRAKRLAKTLGSGATEAEATAASLNEVTLFHAVGVVPRKKIEDLPLAQFLQIVGSAEIQIDLSEKEPSLAFLTLLFNDVDIASKQSDDEVDYKEGIVFEYDDLESKEENE